MRGLGRTGWAVAGCVLSLASAAAAFQTQAGDQTQAAGQAQAADKAPADPKKDADLPPNIAKLPFEIKNGYRVFLKRCTKCHDTRRVEEAKKSLFDWQGTIGKMAFKKDADIPLEDRPTIFLYLSYLQGIQGKPEEKDQYLTFLVKCEDCHGVGMMYKDKHPMKDWPGIVHRMAGKGRAKITPDEEKKVMGYINRMSPDLFGID